MPYQIRYRIGSERFFTPQIRPQQRNLSKYYSNILFLPYLWMFVLQLWGDYVSMTNGGFADELHS